jgi:hypothetical protein
MYQTELCRPVGVGLPKANSGTNSIFEFEPLNTVPCEQYGTMNRPDRLQNINLKSQRVEVILSD